eukprot:216712_1
MAETAERKGQKKKNVILKKILTRKYISLVKQIPTEHGSNLVKPFLAEAMENITSKHAVDTAINTISNPSSATTMIIKEAKVIYANGLIDEKRNYMSDFNIINNLLNIIRNGIESTDPECKPTITAALTAIIPLLDNNKCKNDFVESHGIDIFAYTLDYMCDISGLIADGINKVVIDSNENDKLTIDQIVKLCRILNKTYSTE